MGFVPREKAEDVISRYANGQSKKSIAKELGIVEKTVARILRNHEQGVPQGYAKSEEAERRREYIRANWCVRPAKEIAEDLGVDECLVYRVAKKLGLEYPKEWVESNRKISLGNLALAHTKEVYLKRGKAYAKTYEKEKLRIKYGLGQRTSLKISSLSKKAYVARKNLEYKYNYFPIEGDDYALGYDSETRRVVDKPRFNEKYYINKYGFKFLEGEE